MTIARKLLAVAVIFVTVAAAGPVLYALDGENPSGSMMSSRSMGGRHMMEMIGMGRMMSGCASMMQGDGGGGRPNDQWRKHGSPEGHE